MFGKTRDKLILRLLDEAGRDRALIDGSRDVIGRIDAEVVRLRTKLRSNAIRIGELEVKLRGAQSSRDLVYLNHTNTLDLLDRARVEIQSLTEKLAAKERGILSQRSYIQSLRDLEEVIASRALSYGRKITRAYKALTDETDTHAAIELALEALEEFHPVNDNGVIQVPVGPVTPAGPKKTKNVNCRCTVEPVTGPVVERRTVREGRGGNAPSTQESSVEPTFPGHSIGYPPVARGDLTPSGDTPRVTETAPHQGSGCWCKNPACHARNLRWPFPS
jgi:hypothetical protein